ncbi:TRAP transporter small permease subunit [Ancylobacter defluvii]|uniref:TRAP transporter small permease protein n=1 Tax=Ancylobacter defluvii TaxID=1282440 RepID=A0A9W6NCY6_9HYPH|nr:TRAP transporter small permease [Ancylobacter defluvii]MBS7586849.1 TRAP transporter small permease [Ancylobacter defluvii]GLK86155.1 C4-dicarboxylate ABC transporter permease [Ancylobacter defluvii]
MKTYSRFLGVLFGALMILLSVAITVETLLRKLFSVSLGGVDELGGYAIAIAAPLAFTVALVENAHIRINQLTTLFPKPVQAVLDAVSVASMAVLAGYFFYFTVDTVIDTFEYQSIAPTPWATPLIYPQTVWLIASATFPIAALILAAQALRLLALGDLRSLMRRFGPVSPEEELKAELDDLKRREALIHEGAR